MSDESQELAEEIANWARQRPLWEQAALRALARHEMLGEDEILAFAVLAEEQAAGGSGDITAVTVADILGGSDGNDPVSLVEVTEPQAVNALNWQDGLKFAPSGITLVYGENGSGKSGYARILKKVTRARHETDVLSNVFEAHSAQSARLFARSGSTEHELDWPSEHPEFLTRVSFYDAECAKRYVSTETEVAYRPGAIGLLDDLVSLSARVRQKLEERKVEKAHVLSPLPSLAANTRAAEFLDAVSERTTSLEIDLAVELPADSELRLAALTERITNLAAEDSSKTRSDLNQLLSAVQRVQAQIRLSRELLADDRLVAITEANDLAITARKAADAASAAQFADEPIPGVGNAAWKLLWSSARRFSEESAYPGEPFPVVSHADGTAHCVLCHQELQDDAVQRMRSFDEYIRDDSERSAAESAAAFERLIVPLRTHVQFPTDVQVALERVMQNDPVSHREVLSALESIEEHRSGALRAMETRTEIGPLIAETDLVATSSLVVAVKQKLADLDEEDPGAQLRELRSEEAELIARRTLRDSREAIESHISGLRAVHVVDEAIRLTDTRGVTRRAADLTRTHVSDVLKHHFSQETLRLDLQAVRLADAGGGQGNLKHRAQLVGAVQRAGLGEVLSEGEQTALGLAGFLTEVESDTSRSAVVFDDPVTSLDHVRKERVARRVVELAAQRQVVLFTHDVGFVVDLKRAAEAASVEVAERWVTKFQGNVGRISDGGPWDARMVGERLNDLNRQLGQVRRDYDSGDPGDSHEAARSWYQNLRLVWERALEEVVLGPVLVRGRLELRPSNLKVFVRFSEEDDQEFQGAFTRCGDRGSHDRSSELNRPLPPISELEADLESLRLWHKRVKQYIR